MNHDVLISDDLFPLTEPITIGPSRKNTYVIPANGLPKTFPIFIFEDMHPGLIFNKDFQGHVVHKNTKIPLKDVKKKYDVLSYKGKNSRINQILLNLNSYKPLPLPLEIECSPIWIKRIPEALLQA